MLAIVSILYYTYNWFNSLKFGGQIFGCNNYKVHVNFNTEEIRDTFISKVDKTIGLILTIMIERNI